MLIIIADEQPLTRAGIALTISECETDAEICEVGEWEEAVALLGKHESAAIVCDLNLHPENVQLIDSIRKISQSTLILIYTAYSENVYAIPSIMAGADGFLSKKATKEEFKAAWKAVVSKRKYVSPLIQHFLLNNVTDSQVSSAELILSKREIEVMRLMKRFYSTAKISKTLSVKPNTVTIHKRNILNKLKMKDERDFYSKMMISS